MLACAALSDSARAQAPANPDINPEFQDQVAMLNEFSERRRVNVFFPNEQSVFHGVPVGFVNVGRGNFSFVRRDLVTAGRVPVILARVYDSAWDGPTDFSPGWRLSLAETIETLPDGSLTEYTYNADGLLTLLQRGAEQASFNYDAAGRITAIAFPGGNTHEYRYDDLGLRTRTTRSDGGHKYYRYDATGNLVRGGGTEHSGQYVSQALTLDDDNKVLEAEFANESTLQPEYDAQGNPTLLDWGNRTLACSYDPQGRLIRVDDSSGGLSEYQYAPGEPDIRRQWDTRVGPTLSEQRRESAAQQDLPAARYTRPAGTPWQGVAWNPALTQYDLPQEEGLVLPDALAQAAERRRHLLHTLASDPKMQAHFAMPSNSFFMPPEYVSVNCWLPGCWLSGGGLSVPATAYVGQPLSMTTSISAFGPDCWPVIYDWFVDGQYLTSGSNATSHSVSHTVQTPGTHTVQTWSYCGCDMYPIIRTASLVAEAPPPPPNPSSACSRITYDAQAVVFAEATPFNKPYEHAGSLTCNPTSLVVSLLANSVMNSSTAIDVCELNPVGGKAIVHTHPRFTSQNVDQYLMHSQKCRNSASLRSLTTSALNQINNGNLKFSEGDTQAFWTAGYSGVVYYYLRTSAENALYRLHHVNYTPGATAQGELVSPIVQP